MTTYLCPICRYRRETGGKRPLCDRPRHGDIGRVHMLTPGEHARAVAAGVIAPDARTPEAALTVAPDALLSAIPEEV